MEYSQTLRKQIIALGTKAKARAEAGLFIAEGTKSVSDLIGLLRCRCLLATPTWIDSHTSALSGVSEIIGVKKTEMERMTRFSTASEVIAVFEKPIHNFSPEKYSETLSLALDGVQDPGNLGTIIRVADWMGVRNIICSEDTVDAYNPKVVQSTMGAIGRVNILYINLRDAVIDINTMYPEYKVFGTYLNGENIYTSPLSPSGLIVMGNEGHGISEDMGRLINRRLTIPSFATGDTSESLNVAVATAITLSEFRRRIYLASN